MGAERSIASLELERLRGPLYSKTLEGLEEPRGPYYRRTSEDYRGLEGHSIEEPWRG